MVRSLGRFDVYFVCFIISDLSRSDTREFRLIRFGGERGSRHWGEEGELKKNKVGR